MDCAFFSVLKMHRFLSLNYNDSLFLNVCRLLLVDDLIFSVAKQFDLLVQNPKGMLVDFAL